MEICLSLSVSLHTLKAHPERKGCCFSFSFKCVSCVYRFIQLFSQVFVIFEEMS